MSSSQDEVPDGDLTETGSLDQPKVSTETLESIQNKVASLDLTSTSNDPSKEAEKAEIQEKRQSSVSTKSGSGTGTFDRNQTGPSQMIPPNTNPQYTSYYAHPDTRTAFTPYYAVPVAGGRPVYANGIHPTLSPAGRPRPPMGQYQQPQDYNTYVQAGQAPYGRPVHYMNPSGMRPMMAAPRPPVYPPSYPGAVAAGYRPVQYIAQGTMPMYGRPLPRPPMGYHQVPPGATIQTPTPRPTFASIPTAGSEITPTTVSDNPDPAQNPERSQTPSNDSNNGSTGNTNESRTESVTYSTDYQQTMTRPNYIQGYTNQAAANYYYYDGNYGGVPRMTSYSSMRAVNYATTIQNRESDNASVASTSVDAAARSEALAQVGKDESGESLETMRQAVKKSNDPKVQLDFAKQVIKAAENFIANNPDADPKKAKRTQDLLQSEALRYIKKAAGGLGLGKPGHPDALFLLADCYGNGALGLSIDHDKAFSLYIQASKQSHPAGTYRAAVCCEVGAGTRRDATRAGQLYRKAAALGDTAAMYKLGMILLNGTLGQTKNPREGVTWLKRAASQADTNTPHALHELALLYEGKLAELGNVVIPDPAYAYELFVRSAQLGYSPSQYKLGLCYEYGHLNLPIDPKRSIGWYTKAAQQGDPEAELALSGWYLTGSEGLLQQSDQEAYLWARKAADKGLAKAEYAVGYFSENGVGVRQDTEEARKWYQRAAGQGNRRAIARLNEISYGGHAAVKHYAAKNFRSDADARNGECSVM